MTDDLHLSDLVTERGELRDLRSRLKQLRDDLNVERDPTEQLDIADVLALSPKNDAGYIRPSDLEKAEWFADLYEAQGKPDVHPRGFHYIIIHEDVERRNGDPYGNTTACWRELKEGTFWAQLLGLVDADRIGDSKNDREPVTSAFDTSDRPLPRWDRPLDPRRTSVEHAVDDGYRRATIPRELGPARVEEVDVEAFIDQQVERVVRAAFDRIQYHHQARQDYYVEVWAEKSGVIPTETVTDYGATVREADGGEFSYQMCRSAIELAAARDQDLAIVVVADYDPKGHDMSKSVARKVEIESLFHDCEAEVVHGAVTKEHVRAFALPGTPASKPRGLDHGNRGAVSYETHKDLFRNYAGQEPVEIQAFSSRYPSAFRQALEDCLRPYVDESLSSRIDQAIEDARADARDGVRAAFLKRDEDLATALGELETAVERYQERMNPHFGAAESGLDALHVEDQNVRREEGVPDRRDAFVDIVESVDWEGALADVSLELPTAEVDLSDGAVLDTRRSLLDQLDAYKRFDMRYDE
ncbi:hypothetical protein [Halomarina oriensis]|uniref:Uncharacterized protein n=1 Tax=Halomarina oriensis TaxID=671145 RepID=A0A6B0GVQ9_9EURY|nr:hypothetical protein [Halomarina oriensis]MWG36225.1 hypothetical protein [Halomarina oriensis]